MRWEKTLNGHEKFLQSLSMLLLVLKKNSQLIPFGK